MGGFKMSAKSKTIIRQKRTKNYTTIPNEMLNNTELSFKAKGIHAYLLSKPDNWAVYLNQLKKASKDGYDSVASGIEELITHRYVFRRPFSGDDPGGWEYFVYDEPPIEDPFRIGKIPNREISELEKPATTNTRLEKVRTNIRSNSEPPLQVVSSSDLFPPDQPTVDSNASEASASKIDPPKDEKVGFAKNRKSPPIDQAKFAAFRVKANKLFNRRETTAWSSAEMKAAIPHLDTPEDEWDVLTRYYAKRGQKDFFPRTSLITLLHNWGSEIDKAKAKFPDEESNPDFWKDLKPRD
jgi:hypothetical protein